MSSFTQALSILLKTLPYLLLRLFVYFTSGILLLIYGVIVYFIGRTFASLHPNAPMVIYVIGFLLPLSLSRFLREYLLYTLKAGHIAVIVQLAFKGGLPEGMSQIQWGKAQVMKRFKETSALFVVDRLVNGVIAVINGMMYQIGNLFSVVPGVRGLVKLSQTVLRFSLTYVDESILARNFIHENESIWESAKTGLVLYAQSWKEILKTALFLGFLSIVSYAVLVLLFLMPAFTFGKIYPNLQWVWIIGAFIFAAVVKLALLDPFSLICMILVYIKKTEGKTPDPAWEEKLEGISSKFKQIKQNALARSS